MADAAFRLRAYVEVSCTRGLYGGLASFLEAAQDTSDARMAALNKSEAWRWREPKEA